MKYALTWLVLAIVAAIGIGSLNWRSYRRMAARGVSTQATVIELLPQTHDTRAMSITLPGERSKGRCSRGLRIRRWGSFALGSRWSFTTIQSIQKNRFSVIRSRC